MTKEPPISWDGVSLFTSSARNAVTSVVQAKPSLCQEMFCPSTYLFIRKEHAKPSLPVRSKQRERKSA
jgi:hypothetical protein